MMRICVGLMALVMMGLAANAAAQETTTLVVTVDSSGTIRMNGAVMPSAAAVAERVQAAQGAVVAGAGAAPLSAPPTPQPSTQTPTRTSVATVPPAAAPAIQWSDTYVSFRGLWQDRQPGSVGDVEELAGNIAYVNGWSYGSNFVSLDFESYSRRDGANAVSGNVTTGSAEFYGVFRTVFSGNKISGTQDFALGPIADVGLELGADLATQDDQFAAYKKLVVVGPQFTMALPRGFWKVSVHMSHEWDTNAYLPNGNGTNFDVVPQFETVWSWPFHVGPAAINFTGYAELVMPKGKGASADFEHRTEFLAHPKLLMDVGDLMGYQSGKIDAGIGYEYWLNKFGDASILVGGGTRQSALFGEVGYHFH